MNKKSANRQRHKQSQHRLKPAYAAVLLAFAVQTAQANPTGGSVVNGSASFATSGNTLTVINTPGTIINWQGFSIGSSEVTNFVQQSASSTVLNRVVGNDPSSILGTLHSNGRVFLINPNGILFGAGSVVDVAGLVASTLNLSDADFLAGRNHFTEVPGAGNISNAGRIKARSGGQIYLLAPNVENTGVITAPNGEILLAAGASVDLVNTNDPNLRVNITAPAGNVTNVGQLIAKSGSLGLFGTIVSNSGVVSADGAAMRGGKIVFKASERVEAGGTISARGAGGGTINLLADMQSGTVNVTGKLNASAPNSGNGGFIDTSAAHVQVADTAHVTTAAAHGKSGNWLIDPFDFTIGAGGDITGATLSANLATTDVTIASTDGLIGGVNGDVNVNDAVSWASAHSLTLSAEHDVNINAAISNTGTGAVTLRADMNATCITGAVAGLCGTVTFTVPGHVTASTTNIYYNPAGSNGAAPSYATPTDYTVNVTGTLNAAMLVNDVTQLQAMNTNLAGSYALGADIDASATFGWNLGAGFAPVGVYTYFPNPYNYSPFTGQFDGLGHTISNLYINRPTENYVGLFGYVSGGSISNVVLASVNVTGASDVGGLAGLSDYYSKIGNSSVTSGNVNGASNVGGLVGVNYGIVDSSSASGWVKGSNSVGGLVGYNGGTVSNSNASSSGQVSGSSSVGGLVGYSYGTISNSYVSTGYIWGNHNLGGLVGANFGIVNNSHYDIGNVGILDNWGTYVTLGGLYTAQYNDWLSQGLTLNIADYSSLAGSGNNYTISTEQGMKDMLGFADNAAYTFSLAANINLTTSGFYIPYLAADFNGKNFTISNLNVNQSFNDNLGLFGHVASGSTVSNVVLSNAAVTGYSNVAALAGWNEGTVNGVHVNGANVSGVSSVGGLVGYNHGSSSSGVISGGIISGSYVSGGTVSATGNNVGGLVGDTSSKGKITGNYVDTGTVVNGGNYVGGLVGWDSGEGVVSGNTVTDTTVNGNSYVGGMEGEIVNAYSMAGSYSNNHVVNSFVNGGTVLGSAYVGGLVGWNNADFSNSSVSGTAVTGASDVGGLVGYNNGNIDNNTVSSSTVNVSGFYGGSSIGGLVGNNNGTISKSHVISTVIDSGFYGGSSIGGLVGNNYGTVSGSNVSGGSVTGTSDVGGLVGYNAFGGSSIAGSIWGGHIINSYVSGGTVTATGNNAGGLVGNNVGKISGSNVSGGSVTGSGINSGNIGGLVGYNYGGSIDKSFVKTANVTGVSNVGGLVGQNGGSTLSGGTVVGAISGSYVSGGTVNGTGNNVGGLVGLNQYSIDGNHVIGVAVTGINNVGGLVGLNIGGTGGTGTNATVSASGVTGAAGSTTTVSNSYVSGGTVSGGSNVGGLVGFNSVGLTGAAGASSGAFAGGAGGSGGAATISNTYVSGGLVIATGSDVGGLVGNNSGTIDTSYVSGNNVVSAVTDGSGNGGGLVGYNSGAISISLVSNGSVSASGIAWHMGGLVGDNAGTIANTYASGGVISGASISYAGGLVGYNSGTISTSYASTGMLSGGTNGGLVGVNYGGPGSVSASFWNTTTAGAGVSFGIGFDPAAYGGAVGMSDADMKTLANFNSATAANGNVNPGWDISASSAGTIWHIAEGTTMPLLSISPIGTITVPNVIDEIVDITDQREKRQPEEEVVVADTSTGGDKQALPMCN